MRWKLSCAGLILFPLVGAYCFTTSLFAAVFADFAPGPADTPRGMGEAYAYAAGGVLSLVAFLACLVILIKTPVGKE